MKEYLGSGGIAPLIL